jgi:hypothetical protein
LSVSRFRRRARRYRYSLTTIDVMFAAVAEPPEIERARDRKDHRAEAIVLSFGFILVLAATAGAAVALQQIIIAVNKFLV